MPRKFQRTSRGGIRHNKKNERGRVQVRIVLKGTDGGPQKGNISRAFTIANARVSTVTNAIKRALFGNAA